MSKLALCFLVYNLWVSSSLAADDSQSFWNKIRPKLIALSNEFLGEERTNELFKLEPAKPEIKLPTIPTLTHDATSTAAYESSKQAVAKASEDEKNDEKKFDYLFVKEIISVTKNRLPTDEELSQWLNVLEQGGTREGVYRAIVLDQAYGQLESDQGYQANPEMVDFFVEYFEKYLNRKVNPEQVAQWNLYTHKRIATEKTLEVVDALKGQNPDDLFNWYAVFSSDLAHKLPEAWQNELRKVADPHIHKRWVQAVPEQHMKSEVMIKLHRVFNYLYQKQNP